VGHDPANSSFQTTSTAEPFVVEYELNVNSAPMRVTGAPRSVSAWVAVAPAAAAVFVSFPLAIVGVVPDAPLVW
jgi:hypothetical protein